MFEWNSGRRARSPCRSVGPKIAAHRSHATLEPTAHASLEPTAHATELSATHRTRSTLEPTTHATASGLPTELTAKLTTRAIELARRLGRLYGREKSLRHARLTVDLES